jgi:hypothetical protein
VRWRLLALGWGLSILLSLSAQAAVHHGARWGNGTPGGNCVAYARAVTGIQLDGNAAMWWPHAAGRYERGQEPKVGAILVFKSSGYMRSGHVAVVSRIVGPREILIDHANWIRGRVTRAMSVTDTSPGNDWTSVKVQLAPNSTAGRNNPTFGFIYPRAVPPGFMEANIDGREPRSTRFERVHVEAAHKSRPAPKPTELAEAASPAKLVAVPQQNRARHRPEPH